jgi:hypothetical protein
MSKLTSVEMIDLESCIPPVTQGKPAKSFVPGVPESFSEPVTQENEESLISGESRTRLKCRDCGRVFKESEQQAKLIKDYSRQSDRTVICAAGTACRGRQLSAAFEERGVKQWSRHSHLNLLIIMDLPPADWERSQKWKSTFEPWQRVLAAIEFLSTCWPVCLLYAVQIDANGEPIKEHGHWKHHTTRSLGEFLHIPQKTVWRAILYLKRRHLIMDPEQSEGRYGLDLAPNPFSSDERESLSRQVTQRSGDPYRALLPSVGKFLRDTLDALSSANPESCAELRQVAADACTQQNRAFAEARAQAAQTVREACHKHSSLLSRGVDSQTTSSSGAVTDPCAQPSPSEAPGEEGGAGHKQLPAVPKTSPEGGRVNGKHTNGSGKGALAKLDRPRQSPDGITPEELEAVSNAMAERCPAVDDDAVKQVIRGSRAVVADATAQEIVDAVREKSKYIKRQTDNPVGLLISIVPKHFASVQFRNDRQKLADERSHPTAEKLAESPAEKIAELATIIELYDDSSLENVNRPQWSELINEAANSDPELYVAAIQLAASRRNARAKGAPA